MLSVGTLIRSTPFFESIDRELRGSRTTGITITRKQLAARLESEHGLADGVLLHKHKVALKELVVEWQHDSLSTSSTKSPADPTVQARHNTAIVAEGKSPKQRARKRSLVGTEEPCAKRRAGNAAVNTENVRPSSLTIKASSSSVASAPVPASASASDGVAPRRVASTRLFVDDAAVNPAGKPYACSMCPKRFTAKSSVAPHERTHTGEKPYACSMCPRRFTNKGDVAPHERTHTGEKPYACSVCPMRFARKDAVARHERTHTGG